MPLRSWSRPARHRACALLLRGLQAVLRLVPRPWVRTFGRICGRGAGAILWGTNRALEETLTSTLIDAPKTHAVWADLGCRAAEFLVADRFTQEVCLSPGARELYERALAEGRGVLMASAHLGHWELMAAALSERGFSVTSIAAQPKGGPLGTLLAQHRESLGVNTLAPGRGARAALRRLKRGEAVGLFVDQATTERSRSIPFLGRAAPTPLTFERLLEASGAVPLFIWNHRDASGRYIVHVEAVPLNDSLLWLTARLETLVQTFPTQWVWLHQRWTDRGARIREPDEVPSPL